MRDPMSLRQRRSVPDHHHFANAPDDTTASFWPTCLPMRRTASRSHQLSFPDQDHSGLVPSQGSTSVHEPTQRHSQLPSVGLGPWSPLSRYPDQLTRRQACCGRKQHAQWIAHQHRPSDWPQLVGPDRLGQGQTPVAASNKQRGPEGTETRVGPFRRSEPRISLTSSQRVPTGAAWSHSSR